MLHFGLTVPLIFLNKMLNYKVFLRKSSLLILGVHGTEKVENLSLNYKAKPVPERPKKLLGNKRIWKIWDFVGK